MYPFKISTEILVTLTDVYVIFLSLSRKPYHSKSLPLYHSWWSSYLIQHCI